MVVLLLAMCVGGGFAWIVMKKVGSKSLAFGGGFLVAILASFPLGMLLSFSSSGEEPTVQTALSTASDKPNINAWSEAEYLNAAKGILQGVKNGEKDLGVGIQTQDIEGITSEIVSPMNRRWQMMMDHPTEPGTATAELWSECGNLAMNFGDYAKSFTRQDGINNLKFRRQDLKNYKKELDACQKLVTKMEKGI